MLRQAAIAIKLWLQRIVNHCTHFPLDSYRAQQRLQQHRVSILHDDIYDTKNPYLCIFSQFDSDGNIPDYCAYYLQQLQTAGCDIVLVSTSPRFSQQAIDTAKRYCKTVLHRSNIGRDIYSYKVGLQQAADIIDDYKKVIVANDSVFGPFFDLTPLFSYGDQHDLDVWGASDSHENNYHLQSYFMVFNQAAAQSTAFKQWWQNVRILDIKQHIIDRYELKMAKYFTKAGFKCGAYYNAQDKSNPTIKLWDQLISQHQFPFLKKEVVKFHLGAKPDVDFAQVITKQSPYDIDLIN